MFSGPPIPRSYILQPGDRRGQQPGAVASSKATFNNPNYSPPLQGTNPGIELTATLVCGGGGERW